MTDRPGNLNALLENTEDNQYDHDIGVCEVDLVALEAQAVAPSLSPSATPTGTRPDTVTKEVLKDGTGFRYSAEKTLRVQSVVVTKSDGKDKKSGLVNDSFGEAFRLSPPKALKEVAQSTGSVIKGAAQTTGTAILNSVKKSIAGISRDGNLPAVKEDVTITPRQDDSDFVASEDNSPTGDSNGRRPKLKRAEGQTIKLNEGTLRVTISWVLTTIMEPAAARSDGSGVAASGRGEGNAPDEEDTLPAPISFAAFMNINKVEEFKIELYTFNSDKKVISVTYVPGSSKFRDIVKSLIPTCEVVVMKCSLVQNGAQLFTPIDPDSLVSEYNLTMTKADRYCLPVVVSNITAEGA
jgi:hypothetical protein